MAGGYLQYCMKIMNGRAISLWIRDEAHTRMHLVLESSRLRLTCDGTRAETRFRLSAKRTSPFKSAGASVQSTTDIQLHVSTLWGHHQADFRTYYKKCVYCIVEVTSHFLQIHAICILILICSQRQPDDDPIVSKHVAV